MFITVLSIILYVSLLYSIFDIAEIIRCQLSTMRILAE